MNELPNSRMSSLFETIKCKEIRKSVTMDEKICLETTIAFFSPYNSFSAGWLGHVALLPFNLLFFNIEVRKVFNGVTLRP